MIVCGEPKVEKWFKGKFAKSGKKLKIGKSCVQKIKQFIFLLLTFVSY
jgi:hypothetical protein